MKFSVESAVFEELPTLCIGLVVGTEVSNRDQREEVSQLLKAAIKTTREAYQGENLKEHPAIACYRDAFRRLGFNPNKFLSSIEALTSRVAKGGDPPRINPVVDLVNAISLKYTLPMGAHDLERSVGDIAVRYSREGEDFLPLGQDEPEAVPAGELTYADEREIRTRRWIWRQNDKSKVTAESRWILFPIDGFTDCNRESVERAAEELSDYLIKIIGAKTKRYFLDRDNQSVEI